MSLLNEVLREIDLRKRENQDPQILTSILVSNDVKEPSWIAPALSIILLAVCALSTYLIYHNINTQNTIASTFELPTNSQPLLNDFFESHSQVVTPSHQINQIVMDLKRSSRFSTSDDIASLEPTSASNERNMTGSNTPIQPYFDIQKRSSNLEEQNDFKTLVVKLNSGKLSTDGFLIDLKTRASNIPYAELNSALELVNYAALQPDELLDLLEGNRFIEKNLNQDRTLYLHKIYDQLRLKTNDSGYWAFQQAILYDKSGDPQKAFVYYRQAIKSDHLSEKQRNLSNMRIHQLQLVIGQ